MVPTSSELSAPRSGGNILQRIRRIGSRLELTLQSVIGGADIVSILVCTTGRLPRDPSHPENEPDRTDPADRHQKGRHVTARL